MGMPGEAGKVIFRNVIAKIVEQKKGIKVLGVSKSKGAAEVHSRALKSWLRLNEPLYRPEGHGDLESRESWL
jgi:hypothetical protein